MVDPLDRMPWNPELFVRYPHETDEELLANAEYLHACQTTNQFLKGFVLNAKMLDLLKKTLGGLS